jgi:thymidylate synthase (FAD)
MDKIDVLDKGFIRLVDHMGSDLSIVRNARVSYDAAWRAGENEGSDKKLINYLYKNKHNTPFESVTFTFEVKAPIFVLRQWHRHRTWAYNEISGRYRPLTTGAYLPEQDVITEQSKDNKQMRTDKVHEDAGLIQSYIKLCNNESQRVYDKLIARGCPRELARSVLPLGTYSHMFGTVNLHNAFNFIRERTHEHAQYEIQVYAKAMLELIEPIVPVAVEAFRGDCI